MYGINKLLNIFTWSYYKHLLCQLLVTLLVSLFHNNLILYLKFYTSMHALSALKLVTLSLEKYHKLPVVSG